MTRAHGANRYFNGPDENGSPDKGCRCGTCRKEAVRSKTLHRLAVLRGDARPRVNAGPVRAHVVALGEGGMTRRAIARAAGMGHSTLSRLMGTPGITPVKTVCADTADAILAVHLGGGTDLLVSGVGTQRRIRGLAWQGWPNQIIAEQSGLAHQTVWRFIHSDADRRVAASLASQVAVACRRLYLVDPVAAGVDPQRVAAARKRALNAGCVPLAAWDAIDDPAAVPDFGEEATRAAALLEDSEELIRLGDTPEQAAERLRVTPGYLRRIRSESRRQLAGVPS